MSPATRRMKMVLVYFFADSGVGSFLFYVILGLGV